MKEIYRNSKISVVINENTNEVFHLNIQTGVKLRISSNRDKTSITYDNNELIPSSTNGLPTMLIKPRK